MQVASCILEKWTGPSISLTLCPFPIFTRPRFKSSQNGPLLLWARELFCSPRAPCYKSQCTCCFGGWLSPSQADSAAGRHVAWPCIFPYSLLYPMLWVCTKSWLSSVAGSCTPRELLLYPSMNPQSSVLLSIPGVHPLGLFGSSSPEQPATALHSLCVLTAAVTLIETVVLVLTRSLCSLLHLRAWFKVPLDTRIQRYSGPSDKVMWHLHNASTSACEF